MLLKEWQKDAGRTLGIMQVNDTLGQEINEGDYVVYRNSSRSGSLHYGKVTKIKLRTDRSGSFVLDSDGNPYPTLYIRQVYNHLWNSTAELAGRDTRLSKMERVAVYPTMPEWVKDLFRAAGI